MFEDDAAVVAAAAMVGLGHAFTEALLDTESGPLADHTHQLLVLDVVRLLLVRHGRRGVPEAVTRATIGSRPDRWLRAAQRDRADPTERHDAPGLDREPEPEWDPMWFRLVARWRRPAGPGPHRPAGCAG